MIAYHLLAKGTTYEDLGTAHLDIRDAERVKRRSVQRLRSLGFEVTLTPTTEVA